MRGGSMQVESGSSGIVQGIGPWQSSDRILSCSLGLKPSVCLAC